jgi:S-adenosyl-L-methionine hydrolase (adenosine-forming)
MNVSSPPIIALITDFGPKGTHYVASMKAVIKRINPVAEIIDISHNITPYSILETSYILSSTYYHFPKNTVFVIVVDPGVGSDREILAFKTYHGYFFVGPNNGLFSQNIVSKIENCVSVKNDRYFYLPVSRTFHGRDIMAPIGAHISKDIPLTQFGAKFDVGNIITTKSNFKILPENQVQGNIQYIDSFGNLTTNVPVEDQNIKGSDINLIPEKKIEISFNQKTFNGTFQTHFDKANENEIIFLVGSTGFLEISLNQGDAAEKLGLKVGDKITIHINLG